MKKQIIIGISIIIMVAIISFVVFVVALMERSSKILDKEIQNQKKSYQIMLANDSIAKADTIALTKKKQACEFAKLVRKLEESPDFFKRMNNIYLSNSDQCDPFFVYALSRVFGLKTKSKLPPIGDLDNWASFNFIYLEFPDGFWGKPGVLSILCDNRDKKNPKFFPKIRTKEINHACERELSVAYHVAMGRPVSIPEMEIQKYVLEAIERALHAVKITIACDRVASVLSCMEKEEKKGYKSPSVIITTEDTLARYHGVQLNYGRA